MSDKTKCEQTRPDDKDSLLRYMTAFYTLAEEATEAAEYLPSDSRAYRILIDGVQESLRTLLPQGETE